MKNKSTTDERRVVQGRGMERGQGWLIGMDYKGGGGGGLPWECNEAAQTQKLGDDDDDDIVAPFWLMSPGAQGEE